MKIILAQGNPGAQYASTRHNIGWMLLDGYASILNVEFKPQKKFTAEIVTLTVNGTKVLLVKPTTFYNETGRTARALVDFYKINPASDLLVIHDDLSLPFGTIRVRNKGNDAGNNGVKSLSAHLGPQYWRLRIGVDDDRHKHQPDTDFVLSQLPSHLIDQLHRYLIPTVNTLINQFLEGKLSTTSHRPIQPDTPPQPPTV